jgi:hypothetical protein
MYGVLMFLVVRMLTGCETQIMCLNFEIINFASLCEMLLYFISYIVIYCVKWKRIVQPEPSNIFICIIYTYAYNYTSQITMGKEESKRKCSICLIKNNAWYQYPGILWKRDICVNDHQMHNHCFDEWIKYCNNCPMCGCALIIVPDVAEII